MENENMRIGERIRIERVKRKLSQQKLAERSGVTQSLISQIERGTNRETVHLIAIARALGIDPDALAKGLAQPRRAVEQTAISLHYPHTITDALALIRDPTGQQGLYWLVLLDEHGTQVTLRLADTAVGSLTEKVAQLGR